MTAWLKKPPIGSPVRARLPHGTIECSKRAGIRRGRVPRMGQEGRTVLG